MVELIFMLLMMRKQKIIDNNIDNIIDNNKPGGLLEVSQKSLDFSIFIFIFINFELNF